MNSYTEAASGVKNNNSSINNSLSSIKNISFDGIWSGDAYNAQYQALEQVIGVAENAKADLEKFSEVLEQLEQYKALKEKIDALTEEINSIKIPSAPPSAAAAAMSKKNSLIAERDKLITEKNQLRQVIEATLSTFKAIESLISVINYNPEEHKEYLEYLEKLYEQFGSTMTTEEFMKYLSMLGIGNLLPKNNSDIAHRGFGSGENTAEAFIRAGELGFWGCEADIRFDANGNLVCSHDTVNGNENPTTFEEYLDICKKYGMTAIIDLKYEVGNEEKFYSLSPSVLKVIEEKGMMDSCILQTNMYNDVSNIRSNSEDARIWYLSNDVSDKTVQLIKDNNVECLNLKYNDYSTEQIKKLEKLTDGNVDVCVWNVTSQSTKDRLLGKGATYIMSDNNLGISPYQEGQTDFNSVKGNYINASTGETYNLEGLREFLANTEVENNSSASVPNSALQNPTVDVETTYDGPILVANKGRMDYVRNDGVTVQESWCDISLEKSKELADFYKFDGDKIVEGQKISDMKYWIRDDGVQMIGPYVAVATDVIPRSAYGIDDNMAGWNGKTYNYGDVVETTLGKGIVMGVCTYAVNYREQNGDMYTNLEVYTLWNSPGYSGMVRAKDYVPKNYANDPLLENQ